MSRQLNDLPVRVSPHAEFDAQRAASARKYSDRRNQLGLAFRGAQQEAYEQWEALEDSEEEAGT